jgi:hypothetical protein
MDKERIEIATRLKETREAMGFEDAAQAARANRWEVIAYRSHEGMAANYGRH